MSSNAEVVTFRRLRLVPIDLGVALAVIIALLFGLLLRGQIANRMAVYQSPDIPVQFSYPADWRAISTLQDALLNVEDSYVDSPVKTSLTVQSRLLDPAAPPALEELTDRQINDRSTLMGYHFLSSGPTQIAGRNGATIEYSYVIQPIDEPRRPSLPVVMIARDYLVVAGDRSYYFTINAPESDYERASATMERIINSVRMQ